MKNESRGRLVSGIIVTVLVVAAAFMYLNYTMSRAVSPKAQLEADAYSVSVDYPGIIEKQLVQPGDTVSRGDTLFELKSSSLAEALVSSRIERNNLLFEVNEQNNIVIKASRDGTVQAVNFFEGSYVPANTEIARVTLADSAYVVATYHLRSPDYARIVRDNPVYVTLPDNTKLEGKVFDVTLQKNDEQVETVVKARLDQEKIKNGVFTPGTPVDTYWQLEADPWYETVMTVIKGLFQPTSGR